MRVAVTLPSILFHDIQTYGEGNIFSSLSYVVLVSVTNCISVEEYVDYDRMHEDGNTILTLHYPLQFLTLHYQLWTPNASPQQVYIFVTTVHQVVANTTAEMVTTVAGSGTAGYKDGKGPRADFRSPYGMCMNDDDQCLYICDNGNKSIRKLSLRGIAWFFMFRNTTKTYIRCCDDVCRARCSEGPIRNSNASPNEVFLRNHCRFTRYQQDNIVRYISNYILALALSFLP